jgi:hypothetical protein
VSPSRRCFTFRQCRRSTITPRLSSCTNHTCRHRRTRTYTHTHSHIDTVLCRLHCTSTTQSLYCTNTAPHYTALHNTVPNYDTHFLSNTHYIHPSTPFPLTHLHFATLHRTTITCSANLRIHTLDCYSASHYTIRYMATFSLTHTL